MTLSAGGNQVAGYQYDGLKRRTVKLTYSGGVLSETRDFYYSSGWQVLEERVNGSADAERQFLWGLRYIDDILLRDRDTTGDGTLDERLYGLQDPNWNLTALADMSGAVQERYGYEAYGMPTVMTAGFVLEVESLWDWEIRYAGYRWDEESGLYQVRNRYLNSGFGCFTSRDPLSVNVDRKGPYEYAQSMPITFTDHQGLEPINIREILNTKRCMTIFPESYYKKQSKSKCDMKECLPPKNIGGKCSGGSCEAIPGCMCTTQWFYDRTGNPISWICGCSEIFLLPGPR